MKVTVGVSNRHVHLTEEVYHELFGDKVLEKRNDLNQKGEFASLDTVDLEYNNKVIEHVRVLGPFRKYNQVELLGSDFKTLGLEEVVRKSGDLKDTPGITIIGTYGKVTIKNGVIRAERHLHLPLKEQEKLGLYDNDIIKVSTENYEFTAIVKASENGYLELHIDKDEALEFNLNNNDEVEVNKCLK